MRRRVDSRVTTALEQVDRRLAGISEQISSAAARGPDDGDAGLGDAISSTIELSDVLQRTLAAAEALPAVDGSRISVRRPDGSMTNAVHGLVEESAVSPLGGPPDGAPFVAGFASWESEAPEALRTGLVVPLGPDQTGTLAVYSRLPNAFDAEAWHVLTAIAARAAPAVQNALRYLEVQELAATDFRTGVGSASAFADALPREISAARRHGRPLCLIQIDLDDFGSINRRYSLAVGDTVLEELGERIRSTIRGSDSAFRNSGGADEFFLILPETAREYAQLLYGRLAFEVAARPLGGVEPPVTMSSGLAELRADDTVASLQQRAEKAMMMAKHNDKDQLCTDADDQ
jgi:diguanylate cyclase (GGDEF)-like protein